MFSSVLSCLSAVSAMLSSLVAPFGAPFGVHDSSHGSHDDDSDCVVCLSHQKKWFREVKTVCMSHKYDCSCKAMFHPTCWKLYEKNSKCCPWCRGRQKSGNHSSSRIVHYYLDLYRDFAQMNDHAADVHAESTWMWFGLFYIGLALSLIFIGMEKNVTWMYYAVSTGLAVSFIFGFMTAMNIVRTV